jgi:type III restriction enzyme
MENRFFERPILNSPYEYPKSHWELDKDGQPTQKIITKRRSAEFITPIPKPRKRKKTDPKQTQLDFGSDEGLSTAKQRYDPTPVINSLRREVDIWRSLPNQGNWRVTPETARLLRHWRHHKFNDIRPFFCQVEAMETLIWLTEVAPQVGVTGRGFLDHLEDANNDANPELMRLALKMAGGPARCRFLGNAPYANGGKAC